MKLVQTISPLRTLYAKILPSGEDFTKLFKKQAAYSRQASKRYLDFLLASQELTENQASRLEFAQEQKRELFLLEKQADAVEREINQALHSTYMVPFDRPQITHLASHLDTTLDRMKDVVERIERYRLPIENDMVRMAEIACNCSGMLDQAVGMLDSLREHSGELRQLCDKIRLEEKQADQLFETACARMFAAEAAIDGKMLAYERVYELMEDVVDAYEDAAGTLEDILIDYR